MYIRYSRDSQQYEINRADDWKKEVEELEGVSKMNVRTVDDIMREGRKVLEKLFIVGRDSDRREWYSKDCHNKYTEIGTILDKLEQEFRTVLQAIEAEYSDYH